MTVWFTVQLADRPGSLAQVANALAERNVNITGIVGVAEDTDGALMLTTSDAESTRRASKPGARVRGARPHGRVAPGIDDRRRLPAGRDRTRRASRLTQRDPMARRTTASTAAIPVRRLRRARGDVDHRRRGRGARQTHPHAVDRATARRRSAARRDRARGRGCRRGRARGGAGGHRRRRTIHRIRALGTVFGKRIIVVGGGAQVAQVALGAVSEADRHNLRGSGSRSTRSPWSARRISPLPCGPSPTCLERDSSCWRGRSWAATSAQRPTSCATSAFRSSP